MTPGPQAENRGEGGRDGDLALIRERYTLLPGATLQGQMIFGDLLRLLELVTEARDEREQAQRECAAQYVKGWNDGEADAEQLRRRAEKAEEEIAALRVERDEARDVDIDAIYHETSNRTELHKAAKEARRENAALRARVEALEGALGGLMPYIVYDTPDEIADAAEAALAGGTAAQESAGALALSREEAGLVSLIFIRAEQAQGAINARQYPTSIPGLIGHEQSQVSALRARIAAWLERPQ